jgi:hypothetical protein
MKNYTEIRKIPNHDSSSNSRRNIIAVMLLIILPLVLGGIFVAQKFKSNAEVITRPENFHAERLSATSAQIDFETSQEVKATIFCAVSEKGVKFFCGNDKDVTEDHSILTADFKVNLNTGQGYYVYTNIPGTPDPIGYIPADKDDPTFGLDVDVYNDDSLGLCDGDEGFDPKLDVNQDGCVYTNDLAELY